MVLKAPCVRFCVFTNTLVLDLNFIMIYQNYKCQEEEEEKREDEEMCKMLIKPIYEKGILQFVLSELR